MEKNSRQGYFLQWLIGVGDLVLINALFLVLYRALSADYTRLIGHSLKEIILLLNFCYFFALYFVPVRVAPFGNLRVIAYLQLAAAYRSLSRPSSFRNA